MKGIVRNRVKGKGKPMEWEEIPMGEPNPAMIQVVLEETVRTSASATALGGQAQTGVGPPQSIRASLHGDG